MINSILLLDCSKLQSIYDVMIAIWRYESKRQVSVTQDALIAEVFAMFKQYPNIDARALSIYFEREYEFPFISPESMPYFIAFHRELKRCHTIALMFKDTYHYICTHNDTLYIELE